MSKKMKVYLVAVTIIVLLAAGGSFYFYQFWLPAKQMKIQLGLASDKFPWRDYSQAELDKMYPQIKYADIPTRVTPEETYAKFREALKTNNLEMALAQLDKLTPKYKNNKKTIEQAYRNNKFKEAYTNYPEKIEKEHMYEAIASYSYDKKINNETFSSGIGFAKNQEGDWLLIDF